MPFLLSHDGVRLHYETEGSGPPLVLHTGGAGDGSMWRDAGYVQALSGVCECILFDHRGHGLSDQPKEAAAHKMECYVDDLVALLDQMGHDRVAFWAYSQGLEIGLGLAKLHPERLSALITTGVVSDPDRERDITSTLDAARGVRERGWEELLAQSDTTDLPAWFRRQIEKTNPDMVALWMDGVVDWDPWARLHSVTAPTLMFVGELEDPEDWNSRLARSLRDARVIRLPGLDHLQAYIRTDLVLPEAISFLAATVTSPR